MKNGLKVAFVYIGLVIGAGFASGQEIFQYFTKFSRTNAGGVVVAGLCFIFVAYLILNKTYREGLITFDDYICAIAGRFTLPMRWFFRLYMFCGFFVMLAGSGALLRYAFGLNELVGIAGMAILCFIVFAFDIKGIVTLSSILVPLMIAGVFIICSLSLIVSTPVFAPLEQFKNNPAISALCYVSYNTITAGAVLVPLCRLLSPRSIRVGSVLGGGILGLLIFLVWMALSAHYELLIGSEIPLYSLAVMNGSCYKWVYSAVLIMAICTTAVSHGFGLLSQCPVRSEKERLLFAAVLCLGAVPFARFGFSALVEHLYSFFGYAGLIWLGMVLWDAVRSLRKY